MASGEKEENGNWKIGNGKKDLTTEDTEREREEHRYRREAECAEER